jgi:hypothetical protein
MTAPRRSRAELEANLDALHGFFTHLEQYRGLDAADLEAQILVQLGRGEPRHYERVNPEELKTARRRLLWTALWERKCRYFRAWPDRPLSAAKPRSPYEAAILITSFLPEETLPPDAAEMLTDQTPGRSPRPDAPWCIAVLGGLDGMLMRQRFLDYYTRWLNKPETDDATDWGEFQRWMRAERDGIAYTPVINPRLR